MRRRQVRIVVQCKGILGVVFVMMMLAGRMGRVSDGRGCECVECVQAMKTEMWRWITAA